MLVMTFLVKSLPVTLVPTLSRLTLTLPDLTRLVHGLSDRRPCDHHHHDYGGLVDALSRKVKDALESAHDVWLHQKFALRVPVVY